MAGIEETIEMENDEKKSAGGFQNADSHSLTLFSRWKVCVAKASLSSFISYLRHQPSSPDSHNILFPPPFNVMPFFKTFSAASG
jgi:hypothetical protein